MARHDLDIVSLTAGVLFLAAAGWWGVADRNEWPAAGWFVPVLLVVLGLVGLLGGRRRDESRPATTGTGYPDLAAGA